MADVAPAGQAPAAARPRGGFLQTQIGGFPLWVWGVVVIAGVGIALIARKRSQTAGNMAGTGSQTTNSGAANLPDSIDPVTGVPYSIEGAINPATGLPAYYGPQTQVVTPGPTQGGVTNNTATGVQSPIVPSYYTGIGANPRPQLPIYQGPGSTGGYHYGGGFPLPVRAPGPNITSQPIVSASPMGSMPPRPLPTGTILPRMGVAR